MVGAYYPFSKLGHNNSSVSEINFNLLREKKPAAPWLFWEILIIFLQIFMNELIVLQLFIEMKTWREMKITIGNIVMADYMSHKYTVQEAWKWRGRAITICLYFWLTNKDIFLIETWKRKTTHFNKGICLKANSGM